MMTDNGAIQRVVNTQLEGEESLFSVVFFTLNMSKFMQHICT